MAEVTKPILLDETGQEIVEQLERLAAGTGTTDHTELTNRDAADQHTIYSITGLRAALDGKQPTISDLATIRQNAADGADAKETADQLETDVTALKAKVPSQASAQNQLADKAFVNSSVQTATSNFRGNWDSWDDVPTDPTLYPADYAGVKTPSTNDYLVIVDASDFRVSNPLVGTWRFKYAGVWATDGKTGWQPEYQVNETPLTAVQLAALNSGVTDGKVSGYDTHVANNDIHVTAEQKTAWSNKQDAINSANKLPIGNVSGYSTQEMVVTYDDDTTQTFRVLVVTA